MSIQRKIKAMGGGGGGRGGGEGGVGGGSGGGGDGHGVWIPCKEAHDNCKKPSKESYCNKELLHEGSHKCRSCGKSF